MQSPLSLTVNSTHFYLIDCAGGLLLVDAGWELAKFTAAAKAQRVNLAGIRWVMFTHHHPDHAGLVQSVKGLSGARMIIHANQIPFLADLQGYYAKKGGYEPIRVEPGDLVGPDRAALRAIGIQGEIVETPGHSPDSVSLLLEDGRAFIGDLPAPDTVWDDTADEVRASWRTLIQRGARVFYHAHAGAIPLERIQAALDSL